MLLLQEVVSKKEHSSSSSCCRARQVAVRVTAVAAVAAAAVTAGFSRRLGHVRLGLAGAQGSSGTQPPLLLLLVAALLQAVTAAVCLWTHPVGLQVTEALQALARAQAAVRAGLLSSSNTRAWVTLSAVAASNLCGKH
jgi:hypothetical protein